MSHLVAPTLLLAVVLFLLFTLYRTRPVNRPSSAEDFEQRLLQKCFGNREAVNRLIAHELSKNAHLSRQTAARYAMESLSRDNR